MSEPAFALNSLQVQVVAGFLEQMRAQGYDVADPVETPKNVAFLALRAGYSMITCGNMADYVAWKIAKESAWEPSS